MFWRNWNDMTAEQTTEEKQREVRIQLSKARGIIYQCTECDLEAFVHDDPVFEHCRDMNHFIDKFNHETDEQRRNREKKENRKMECRDIARSVMANYNFKTLTSYSYKNIISF